MKRDTIFYRIFQQSPTLLFDLLPTRPANAQAYRFESIEVKETSFRIDGVLTPPTADGLVFFSEVQMQPDPVLYERIFSEIGIYTYRRTADFADWQALAIYPNRDTEQTTTKVPRELFESGRILPIYLDELGSMTSGRSETIEQLPLGIGLLVLTILEGEEAIAQAQTMMTRARRTEAGNAIMEMLSTIIFYKFKTFSRDEVNAMLGYTLDELKESRAYQEIYTEGREEGREEERLEYTLRLLNAKFGQLPQRQQTSVQSLSLDQLQALGLAVLNFTDLADLSNWLDAQA